MFETASFLHLDRRAADRFEPVVLPLALFTMVSATQLYVVAYCALVVTLLASGGWDALERERGATLGEALMLVLAAAPCFVLLARVARRHVAHASGVAQRLRVFRAADAKIWDPSGPRKRPHARFALRVDGIILR